MRRQFFSILTWGFRRFRGTGLGKLPMVKQTFELLYRKLRPGGTTALIEVQGHKMYVDPRDIGVAWQLMVLGHYEQYQTGLFRKLVKRGAIVVDIGAHIGHYTLIAADLVGDEGHVFAFEPAPDNYALLEKNVALNGYRNITITKKAVSSQTGHAELILDLQDRGKHGLYTSAEEEESIMIETIALDDFFRNNDKRVDMLKMDVEGAELLVLSGMKEILQINENMSIFTEFSPLMLERAGSSPIEYLKLLLDYNFEIYYINEQEERLEAVDIDRAMRIGENEKWTNFVCLKSKTRQELGI